MRCRLRSIGRIRESARPTAAPWCTGAAGARRAGRASVSSTILPTYMTATRSRDVSHDAQVVGDEQVGQVELLLQVLEQVDDLGLNRHVERRDRLVAHDEARLDGERASDADALALAARELVRVAVGEVRIQPDDAQQLLDPLLTFRARGPARGSRAARRRCCRPSCAGSGWRTGPGRSSASRGASCAGRRR